MLGAIIGDIVGSVHEFVAVPTKTKDFGPLFPKTAHFTDDSVCTMAIAEWLLERRFTSPDTWLRLYGEIYPARGYGGMYHKWLKDPSMSPYNSWGNGAPMRVSAAAYAGETLGEVWDFAEQASAVTHNHPQGIKGAQMVAGLIFLLRTGVALDSAIETSLDELDKDGYYGEVLKKSLNEIRPNYRFKVSSKNTVPQAVRCVVEADDFEDAVRNAISLGGDADTLAAITGSIAEARWLIPENIKKQALSRIDNRFLSILSRADLEFNGYTLI